MECGEAAGICSQPLLLASAQSSFFAVYLPFFFFGGSRFLASLVGDEKDERKCTQMPEMRKSKCLDVRQGSHSVIGYVCKNCTCHYTQILGTAKRRSLLPTMWWSEALEKRQQVFTVRRERKNSALALQGLRISVFRKRSYPNIGPFFFLFLVAAGGSLS